MKPFQRLKVVACFFIFISLSIEGFAQNSYALTGYRLSITSIKVTKNNDKTAKIEYNLSNAGRNPIKLGKGRNIPKQLIFEFDASLNSAGMFNHANAIATALREQKVTLRPGQLLMNNKLKVDLGKNLSDLVVVRHSSDEGIENNSSIENSIVSNEETPIVEETILENIDEISETKETFEENPSEVIEETHDQVVESTEEVVTIEKEIKEEKIVSEISSLEDTESIILKSPKAELSESENVTIGDPVLIEETIVEEELEKEVVDIKKNNEDLTVVESSSDDSVEEILQPISTETEEEIDDDIPTYEVDLNVKDKDFLEEDICADLVIESIRILKQSDKSVTLQYVLANYGNGSAALYGESKKDNDNVAIKAHLAKSRKLTRGSIPLKGSFISKGVKNKSGMLLPKDKVTNTMKLDISKMTKFTPVLILSLDGFQDVEECNEFNNVVYINLIEVNDVAYDKPTRPKQETKVLSKIEE